MTSLLTLDSKFPQSKKSFIEYLGDRNLEQLFTHECEQYEVDESIKNFSTSKTSGPFSIPTNILKEFSQFVIEPLTAIINKSLDEGFFPKNLKSALVIPIFKKGDKPTSFHYLHQ